MTMTVTPPPAGAVPRLPLLAVLIPRASWRIVTVSFVAAVAASTWLNRSGRFAVWQAVAAFLVVMLPAGIVKWREDVTRYGPTVAFAGAVVVVQGLHSVEHVVQWIQHHVLGWSLRNAVGLLSPANSEWVHFVWNLLVVVAVVVLVAKGMRGFWGWALLIYALAHAAEHTYLFVRHLQVLAEMRGLGVRNVTAQGLPGVLGQDGLVDRSTAGVAQFVCRLPLVSTASRLDVHAIWNTGEVLLLIPAANQLMRRRLSGARAESNG